MAYWIQLVLGNDGGAWSIPVKNGFLVSRVTKRALADRLNVFLRDPEQKAFVHHPPGEYEAWYLLFYVAASAVAMAAVRRSLRMRTHRWLLTGQESSAAIVATPYRGSIASTSRD